MTDIEPTLPIHSASELPTESRRAPVASSLLGIDIGGANLKYASTDGRCFERPFAMWTHFESLAGQLADDMRPFLPIERMVVTMTGELADCFASRREGVHGIVDAVEEAASQFGLNPPLYYGTDGCFHSADPSKVGWEKIAASNWHALANYVAKEIAADGLLIDIGSTTTDVILIRDRTIQTSAKTDRERLRDRSLVYVGCRRTPVCALVPSLSFHGESVPVMNELFATIDDARLILRQQPEDGSDRETADRKPRDRFHAKARLARMIGLDYDEVADDQVRDWSVVIIKAAARRIAEATDQWTLEPSVPWILSGHGQELLTTRDTPSDLDLRSSLPPGVSRTAPAWAVAKLAAH